MGIRAKQVIDKCTGATKLCIPLRLCKDNYSKFNINDLRLIQKDHEFIDLMEQAGGHLNVRHIAWSNQDLLIRAHKQNLSAATCFTNKQIANKAIKQNIFKNIHKILMWIDDPESPKRMSFYFTHDYIVGKGVKQMGKHVIYNLRDTKIVLQKDDKIKYGFRILTGYSVLDY